MSNDVYSLSLLSIHKRWFIGHKILVASYHIIKEKVPYQELGANYLLERKKKNKIDYLKRQLKELGYNIEKIEKAA